MSVPRSTSTAILLDRPQRQSVFVIEASAARTRLITTGRRIDGSLEALSGLSDGGKVITPLAAILAHGTRVERVEVRP